MDSGEPMGIKRGCRLCLAPDNECVSIFATAAADREALAMKIQACVNIKVHQSDSLSSRICHACISYLNSWQSFKNRCYAAQKKQKTWLAFQLQRQLNSTREEAAAEAKKRRLSATDGDDQQVTGKRTRDTSPDEDFYPEKQTKNNSANTSQRPSVAESESFIKQEPKDDEEQEGPVTVNMELDPSQFLADNDSEEEYQNDSAHNDEGPPILTSLGLTHINHVNPYNYLATDLEEYDQDIDDGDSSMPFSGGLAALLKRKTQPSIPARCQICQMKFSNRANARRHERNIHGIKISAENGDITVVPKLPPPLIMLPKRPAEQGSGQVSGSASVASGEDVKPTMPVLKRPSKQVVEEWDYTKPEKYRHFLTENKLSFIRRNLKFLGQYQDMKCKCCDRSYTTYKTFMSHMRKRFLSLPRNMCFKCLRQFETKGQFIAHLKKKNCLNLYTLYMADTSISKVFHTASPSGRIGPKEILANKAYGCKLCTEQFRLKSDFRTHVNESHPDAQNFRDPMTGNCTYCQAKFEEASQRKRHFGNMECLVFLICGNCEERFDSNPQFLEHVYATHLTKLGRESIQKQATSQMLANQNGDDEIKEFDESGQPNSRSAQNCPVCDKQYNNYYNVLRHMESKHPDKMPKTYHCEICQTGFARQTELREHVKTAHGELSLTKVKPISFMCKECKEQFEKKDAWIEHQVVHGQFMCQQCDFTVKVRDEFETHLSTHIKLKVYSCSLCKTSFNTEEGLQYHTMTTHLVLDSDEALFKQITKAENEVKTEPKDPQSVVDALNLHLDGVEIIAKPRDSTSKPQSAQQTPQTTPQKPDMSVDLTSEPGTSQRPLQYNSRMRCRVCQKRISSKVGYRNHLLIEHQINDCQFVSCDLCPAEFSNEKGLRVHMFRTHNISVKEDENIPADHQHYECNICHTVYRSVDQLRDHVNTVHGVTSLPEFEESMEQPSIVKEEEPKSETLPDYTPIEVWFQCRYCDENFNSNKKLTIHMNTHEEHDSTDYTCRDCGNVYGTRKSLWVHRHKKHPRPQMPSPCEVCSKVFFDKTELGYHLKTHGGAKKSLLDGISGDAEEAGSDTGKYSCHVCGRKFQDKSPLSKHLRIHEMENSMFSSSLLVSALSDSLDQQSDQPSNWGSSLLNNDGEFSCDICPKTFSLLSALKVHRGWHFRSPDGRQVTDPGNIWQPGTLPPSRARRFRPLPSKPPVCPYCSSKFASANNLRRHIVEVHKRNESRMNREAVNPGVFIEKERECSACNKAFDTHIEWIEHKMGHAKNQKPSTTFEWNCEICGKMFTRKERLLQHMITHLNNTGDRAEDDIEEVEDDDEEPENSLEVKVEVLAEEEVMAEERNSESSPEMSESEEKEGDKHSCDLCQVFFKTSAELRRHVTSHFINGAATIGNEQIKGDSPSPVPMVKKEVDYESEDEEEGVKKSGDPQDSQLLEEVVDDTDTDDDDVIEESDDVIEESDEESVGEEDNFNDDEEEFMEEYIDADEIEPKTVEISTESPGEQSQKPVAQAIVYKCRLCATPHRSHFASIKCMEAHRMPTEWKCTKCQVYFADGQQMENHLKLMHD